ncbi:hypothetical protein GJAV_G00067060 [Gymnothorax javanicus]|nr:hypothetical protein GJAV_G00067060 [Gymnothorax javanicus]
MAAKDGHRILLLEEEVRTLSEELVQCQADKEFVWSLWKRLQVANPDLTQAVSLVVEREKQKGEAKDRKVLQILQVKDYKIQELEQRVTSQQQELKEKNQELKEKSQELKACREQSDQKEAGLRAVVAELEEAKAGLEEEKAGLEDHLARMQDDLEKLLERAEVWSQEKSDIHTKAEVLEGELTEAKDQIEALREKCSSLTSELAAMGKELEQSYEHVARLKQDQQQLQSLYTQSVEHASDQAQLIKQLEELNLETQRVLRTQEAAHSADSVSYQRLYSDLNESFQALKASEGQQRQAQIALTSQLHQKEQEILQLQAQLEQRVSTVSAACSPVPQSNCGWSEERTKGRSVRRERVDADASPFNLSLTPSRDVQTNLRTSQGASVQRSRSLSPRSGRKGAFGVLQRAEARVRDLEELLHLKTEESAELKRAHENRQERLHVLQNNCGALKEQLKQAEEAQVHPKGKRQRAQPWELRQEDSDGVWNELAHFKRLSKNLATEKMNLEEEVDVLRVQAAVDRVALQEMRLCLQQERDELLQKEAEGAGGSPEIPSTHTPKHRPARRLRGLHSRLKSCGKGHGHWKRRWSS